MIPHPESNNTMQPLWIHDETHNPGGIILYNLHGPCTRWRVTDQYPAEYYHTAPSYRTRMWLYNGQIISIPCPWACMSHPSQGRCVMLKNAVINGYNSQTPQYILFFCRKIVYVSRANSTLIMNDRSYNNIHMMQNWDSIQSDSRTCYPSVLCNFYQCDET